MSSCTGSSKVAGATLPMRLLTALQNREMEQLVDALQVGRYLFKSLEETVVQRFL